MQPQFYNDFFGRQASENATNCFLTTIIMIKIIRIVFLYQGVEMLNKQNMLNWTDKL